MSGINHCNLGGRSVKPAVQMGEMRAFSRRPRKYAKSCRCQERQKGFKKINWCEAEISERGAYLAELALHMWKGIEAT